MSDIYEQHDEAFLRVYLPLLPQHGLCGNQGRAPLPDGGRECHSMTLNEAMRLLSAAGVHLASEASNVPSAYLDLFEEAEAYGETLEFDEAEFEVALLGAAGEARQ